MFADTPAELELVAPQREGGNLRTLLRELEPVSGVRDPIEVVDVLRDDLRERSRGRVELSTGEGTEVCQGDGATWDDEREDTAIEIYRWVAVRGIQHAQAPSELLATKHRPDIDRAGVNDSCCVHLNETDDAGLLRWRRNEILLLVDARVRLQVWHGLGVYS